MALKKNCEKCGKEFSYYPYRPPRYCSMDCYLQGRFRQGGKCAMCNKPARIRYCSKECRDAFWNKNDYHLLKKKRYWEKKIAIIKELGGECRECGESDIQVLDINHIDREQKKRPKSRVYTWTFRLKEWRENMGNLELLCANCHRRHTWKQMAYGM